MATFQSLFDFFVVQVCYTIIIMLLLSASEGCQQRNFCGNLGEISFPFTTIKDRPECGFYIDGCDDPNADTRKRIQLANKELHEIASIKKNSIHIHCSNSEASCNEIASSEHFHIRNNITISRCSPKFNICFSFGDDDGMFHNLPFCLPKNPLQKPNPFQECTSLISFLEIEVQLKGCEGCYQPERGPCLYNHADFSCYPVPPTPYPPPPSEAPSPASSKSNNAVKIGFGLAGAIITVALFAILFLFYKRRNKSLDVENKQRNTYPGTSRSTTNPESGAVYFGIPVFSYEELQAATNNFDQARELGEGAFGAVYYGKLCDGREVAVKRLFERNYKPVESFTNEIQILTGLRHTNLVSLYGCTSRHSRELLLVYEYVPNGTLSHHLHDDQAKRGLMSWPVRMKIAIETARALTYLHASDIIHRDVKTNNILLDNNFSVKVADFGLSRLYPNDVTHVSTAPRGTPGYVDPDYRKCYQLTTKSDVYSFGVVLAELISSLPAVDLTRDRDDIKLANLAIRKIQRRAFCELVDPSLGFHSDENLKRMIISVAELAFKCLQGDKDLRPSMGEVLEVLQRIESGRYGQGYFEGIDDHGVRVCKSCGLPPLPYTPMRPQHLHQTQ